ncbi:hypothetical protein [Aquamicrobium defluvii]|uniref:Uncharacterized protein n=1 Tax=Aquamicrobium defluvii TaxID=69279 RepID=A0A4R6YL05_9HYPH|nr:hypothetical protein [Aquamicrobium defluvii]TDR37939.1 hypothetical protein DES43_1012 [Aquamicrobium defluvii]
MIRAPTNAKAAQKINALIGLVSPMDSLLLKSYSGNLEIFGVGTSENFAALRRICGALYASALKSQGKIHFIFVHKL